MINVKKVFDKSIVRFLIVGGCCTLVDFTVYMLLSCVLHPTLSKGISMICSMTLSYFLNKFWSFSSAKSKEQAEILKYVVTQIINLLINISINTLVLYLCGVKGVAFVFATLVAMVANYLLQRFWVFRLKK